MRLLAIRSIRSSSSILLNLVIGVLKDTTNDTINHIKFLFFKTIIRWPTAQEKPTLHCISAVERQWCDLRSRSRSRSRKGKRTFTVIIDTKHLFPCTVAQSGFVQGVQPRNKFFSYYIIHYPRLLSSLYLYNVKIFQFDLHDINP